MISCLEPEASLRHIISAHINVIVAEQKYIEGTTLVYDPVKY